MPQQLTQGAVSMPLFLASCSFCLEYHIALPFLPFLATFLKTQFSSKHYHFHLLKQFSRPSSISRPQLFKHHVLTFITMLKKIYNYLLGYGAPYRAVSSLKSQFKPSYRTWLVPPLRYKVWFSLCPHLNQLSGSSANQKDPEDDSILQAAVPIVHEPADGIYVRYIFESYDLRYMTWGFSLTYEFSYTYQRRESETICIHL